MTEVPDDILTREGVLHPQDPLLSRVFGSLRDTRTADIANPIGRLRSLVAGAMPRQVVR